VTKKLDTDTKVKSRMELQVVLEESFLLNMVFTKECGKEEYQKVSEVLLINILTIMKELLHIKLMVKREKF